MRAYAFPASCRTHRCGCDASDEEVTWDYSTIGLTLRSHPLKLLRPKLNERRFATAEQLLQKQDGAFVTYCGIVRLRQFPTRITRRPVC